MNLFGDVMDKELVDRNGHKIGKVDDIVLEAQDGELPVVRSILVGHGALAPILGRRIAGLVTFVRKVVLGARDAEPIEIGWEHVQSIGVVVQIDLDRQEDGLMESSNLIWRRWIGRLPFARR